MFDSTNELAENKLILLYILNKIKSPLSNSLLTEIVLENNLINYFHLQQYISELIDSGFIIINENKQFYSISKQGKNVLDFFNNRISDKKKNIINDYFLKNNYIITNQKISNAEFYKDENNSYIINCVLDENDKHIIELKLYASSKSEAKQICQKWKLNAEEIYKKIHNELNN